MVLRGLCLFFRAHHENGAMGVADDAFGDAAQDSASQGTLSPAADHYDAHAELLADSQPSPRRLASRTGIAELSRAS